MENIKKTPYEWAIQEEVRFVGLEKHPSFEEEFYCKPCTRGAFELLMTAAGFTKALEIITGKLHLKSEKYLELRMYSLVPYNLLGIQMGIQHEHSNTDFVVNHVLDTTKDINERYIRWAKEWKTSILLNGGTSNEGHNVRHGFRDVWYVGSMQNHLKKLKAADVTLSTFYEPDLNSMLTSISFIVDERVFNRKLYKDFVPTTNDNVTNVTKSVEDFDNMNYLLATYNQENQTKWVDKIGGTQNAFLRDFLKNFSLARG